VENEHEITDYEYPQWQGESEFTPGDRVKLKYGIPSGHNEHRYCDSYTGTLIKRLGREQFWLICMDADVYAEVVRYDLPSLESKWGWQSIGNTIPVHEIEMEKIDEI
jgi:hypothetical protein